MVFHVKQKHKNLLPEIVKLYKRYLDSNSTVPFEDFFVSTEQLTEQLNTATGVCMGTFCQRIKQELANDFDAKLTSLNSEVDALRKRVVDLEENAETDRDETFKTPKTFDELAALNKVIQMVNMKVARHKTTWGDNNEFSTIKDEESLVAWLKSGNEYKLTPALLDDFEVCVFDSQLVTLSKDYRGGIGFEALFVPMRKFVESVQKSNKYKSAEHRRNDPRKGYHVDGKRWVPGTYLPKKKRQKTCK